MCVLLTHFLPGGHSVFLAAAAVVPATTPMGSISLPAQGEGALCAQGAGCMRMRTEMTCLRMLSCT